MEYMVALKRTVIWFCFVLFCESFHIETLVTAIFKFLFSESLISLPFLLGNAAVSSPVHSQFCLLCCLFRVDAW